MTAGLQWDEKSHPYSDPRNDWRQASQRDDPVQFVLERPVVHPPGTHFEYNGGLSILLAYLLERETGRHVDELAAELLFRPLGIADVRWDRLPGGITDTDGGLHLRPRDLARIGQLVLAGGTWQGRRVVSREWLERATRSQVSNPDGPDYGYQWWCGDFHHHGKADAAFLASGHGGQALFGLPGRGAVVVIAQDVFDNPVGPLNGLAILGRYVLPALDPACRPAPVVPVPAAALERYTGAYGAEVVAVTVFRRGEALWAEGSDGTSMMLEPLGHDRFRGTLFGLLDLRFVFAPDPDGTIGRVTSSFGFRETTLTRLP
jgi:CubicO group peptidase (beta-lactamase class C family)